MLRYFYILVCIQLCFSTEYIDNKDNENVERRVRGKTGRIHKKHTKSPKKTRLVQFDVQNFMRRADEAVDDNGPYYYMNKRRDNRRVSANYGNYGDYGTFIEPDEYKGRRKVVDYSNIDDNSNVMHTRSSPDSVNARHFNFHSLSFDDKNDVKTLHNHDKATTTSPEKLLADKVLINNPEKKCSFKNMKMPFFSYNKSTTKAKRQKKRKMFCFNCHKKTTTPIQFEDNPDVKTDDFNKDHIPDHVPSDKTNDGENKVSKRAYEQLCPKCIRELLNNLKRKTTKKVKHGTTTHKVTHKVNIKEKTTIQKADNLDDNLHDGFYYLSNVRKKREEEEEREKGERDRRLKELEEVEKKIENVHVTAPTFTRVSFNIEN